MSNDITELRSALFETLRGLKDGSVDVDRAKAINETAQTIINSAKVEVDHMRVAGGRSQFISGQEDTKRLPGKPEITLTRGGTKTVTPIPGGSVTRHTLSG